MAKSLKALILMVLFLAIPAMAEVSASDLPDSARWYLHVDLKLLLTEYQTSEASVPPAPQTA
jgi:hypothetical protein